MGQTSAIEWTDATWNPWQGCTKVSPACEHCYMFRDLARYGRDGSVVVRSKDPTFNLPTKKSRGGEFAIAAGTKVFTCSWADWFHKAADPWRPEAWAIIRRRPDVIFQIVTKRTDRIINCLPADWGDGYPNVWLITTAENQEWLEKRADDLLAVPAIVHGLSIEPMLGPINLLAKPQWLWAGSGLNWVICGGESGPGARPIEAAWVQQLRDQCVAAGVPFFFKQWGEWLPPLQDGIDWVNISDAPDRIGKKRAGRKLDGREWSDFPQLKGFQHDRAK